MGDAGRSCSTLHRWCRSTDFCPATESTWIVRKRAIVQIANAAPLESSKTRGVEPILCLPAISAPKKGPYPRHPFASRNDRDANDALSRIEADRVRSKPHARRRKRRWDDSRAMTPVAPRGSSPCRARRWRSAADRGCGGRHAAARDVDQMPQELTNGPLRVAPLSIVSTRIDTPLLKNSGASWQKPCTR